MSKQKARQVHLHGALKKFSKKPIRLACNDMRSLVSGLSSAFGDEFRKHIIDNPEYVIFVSDRGRKNARPVYAEMVDAKFGDGVEVHMVPAVQGAGLEAAFIAIGFNATAAAIAATVIINIAVAFVLGAISRALAPKPEDTGTSERPEERPSFLYNGPENVIEAGYQEPVVYGTHMTGSVVVSAGITVEQIPYDSIRQAPPPGGSQPSSPPAVPWQWRG